MYTLNDILQKIKNNDEIILKTGIYKFDQLIGGMCDGNLISIGGYTGIGVSSFLISTIKNMCILGNTSVALFNLQFSNITLINKLICNITRLPASMIIDGSKLESNNDFVERGIKKLEESPLYISTENDLNKICLSIKKLVNDAKIRVVIIDNFSTINCYGTQEYKTLVLKRLAMELGIIIIVSYSIGLRGEDEEYFKEQQFFLKANSDICINIDVPENRNVYSDEKGNDMHGIALIKTIKHRSNKCGEISLCYNKDTFSIE